VSDGSRFHADGADWPKSVDVEMTMRSLRVDDRSPLLATD